MIDWVRKKIYDVSQQIADNLRTADEQRDRDHEKTKKELSELSKCPDIIKGESPWKILKNKFGAYSVYVYSYESGNWEDITSCSNKIVGVHEYEIRRIMMEKFNAYRYKIDYDRCIGFENEGDAQIFIDDIAPYYDEYHMPRAMMERMMSYMEGGYPPYFVNHEKCPSKEAVEKETEKRTQEHIKRLTAQRQR